MKFKLTTSSRLYSPGRRLTQRIQLGFKFKDSSSEYYMDGAPCKQILSDSETFIEIDTLEELIEFCKEYDEIVFDGERIELYDGYRE